MDAYYSSNSTNNIRRIDLAVRTFFDSSKHINLINNNLAWF